jgi:hypothetical protein
VISCEQLFPWTAHQLFFNFVVLALQRPHSHCTCLSPEASKRNSRLIEALAWQPSARLSRLLLLGAGMATLWKDRVVFRCFSVFLAATARPLLWTSSCRGTPTPPTTCTRSSRRCAHRPVNTAMPREPAVSLQMLPEQQSVLGSRPLLSFGHCCTLTCSTWASRLRFQRDMVQ